MAPPMATALVRRRSLPVLLVAPIIILATPCVSFLPPPKVCHGTAAKRATTAIASKKLKGSGNTAPKKLGTRKKATAKPGSRSRSSNGASQRSKDRKASTPGPLLPALATTASSYPVSFDDRWNHRYEELKAYKRTHGDCLVPQSYPSNPALGRWVRAQRVEHSCLRKGHDSYITPDRVARLDGLGFVWDAKEATWRTRLEGLRAYKEKYGHCNVSQSDEEHRKLALWVRNQRMHHKYLQRGEKDKSALTPERLKALDELGFIYDVQDAAWMEKFAMLKKFRKEHGHCNVPSQYEENMSLARWVLQLRVQMRERKEQEGTEERTGGARKGQKETKKKRGRKPKSRLTQKRIDLLESVEFCWDPGDQFWWERYNELKAYKEKYGHCSVPAQYPPNPKLGNWVANQSRLCREYARAALALGAAGLDRIPVTGLNEARLEALREINFCYIPSAEDIASSALKVPEVPLIGQEQQATSLLPIAEKKQQPAKQEKKKAVVPFPWDEL